MEFSATDLKVFQKKGISPEEVSRQIQLLAEGVPPIQLLAPCSPGRGIRVLSELELNKYQGIFAEAQSQGRCMKFVPASGAATRLFKDLLAFYQAGQNIPTKESVKEFFRRLSKFPFYNELDSVLSSNGKGLNQELQEKNYRIILEKLLTEQGLGYASLPKALIPFHRYPEGPRTALDEQIQEAGAYTRDENGKSRIHFTISPEHQKLFEKEIKKYGPDMDIKFSFQSPKTDTVTVDLENRLLRDVEGKILFRPGGHGALLENLDQLGGDIVFIKNIDNVSVDSQKEITYLYKRALGGLLVELQSQIFSFLRELENEEINEARISEMGEWVKKNLGLESNTENRGAWLKKILHRPLRVCGMVPQQGEPGGGPFWVKMEDGSVTLQVVEQAQLDFRDPKQKKIFEKSTHFNPVDFVCGLRDHRGKPFSLRNFADENAVFISRKTQHGKKIKALELPGLWNGGMAYWNTVFVEVPLATFNPVKTVNDLLREGHQVDA